MQPLKKSAKAVAFTWVLVESSLKINFIIMEDSKLSTKALHAGHDTSLSQGTRAVPIYQSTSYLFNNSDHAANLFALSEPGFIYTRLNNPTNDVLEKRLASIDGGIGAVVTAGGTAAISTAILTLLKSGDHIVASNSLYGGTYNMFNVMLPRFNIKTTFVDPSNPKNFSDACKKNTRLFCKYRQESSALVLECLYYDIISEI